MARIVRFHQYGDPSVLEIEDVDVPPPAPNEVQIEVKSIGLNRAEVMFRTHTYLQEAQIPEPPWLRSRGHHQVGRSIGIGLQKRRHCQPDPTTRHRPMGHLWRIGQCSGSQRGQASGEHLFRRGGGLLDAVRHSMGCAGRAGEADPR